MWSTEYELGTAAVTRVVEWQVDQLPLTLFPQTPPTAWHELAAEFSPTFWDDDAGGSRCRPGWSRWTG